MRKEVILSKNTLRNVSKRRIIGCQKGNCNNEKIKTSKSCLTF